MCLFGSQKRRFGADYEIDNFIAPRRMGMCKKANLNYQLLMLFKLLVHKRKLWEKNDTVLEYEKN